MIDSQELQLKELKLSIKKLEDIIVKRGKDNNKANNLVEIG